MTQTGNNDSITIQSITEATQQMSVVVNINGVPYAQVVPILTVQDPNLLSTQLQALAQQLRAEFAALTAAVQATDASNLQQVSPAVTSLIGQAIPVDVATPPVSSTPPATDPTTGAPIAATDPTTGAPVVSSPSA